MNVTLGELGELGEMPHLRLVTISDNYILELTLYTMNGEVN